MAKDDPLVSIREDIELLIGAQQDMVQQMSALLKRETLLENRLDALERKNKRLSDKLAELKRRH